MVINYKNTAMLSNSRYLTHNHTHMTGEERRNSMEREISSNRSSCSGGAGEPSSSVASSSVAAAGEEANAHVHVRESAAAAEQSGPVRESVPTDQSAEDDEDDEDVKWEDVKRDMEPVIDQLLFLMKNSTHRPQSNDGGNSGNNFASNNNNSTVVGAVAAGVVVAVDAIIPACNETVSDEKKEEKSSKKKSSCGSSSAHTCEVCGETFAKGQSLGGHKRKHYDIQKIIDNKRAREKQKETPAPAVERRVQEPAELTGHTVEEERTASSCSAPLESNNPAPPLQSVQLEGPSAANGARRPYDFDLNEPAAPDEERENAPLPEPERKDDDDSDDSLLSFRLWPKFDSERSN